MFFYSVFVIVKNRNTWFLSYSPIFKSVYNEEVEVRYVTGSVFHTEIPCDLNALTFAMET
jgi:hypothetical protein